jgi:DNA-directed RNA polymerase subunit beta
MTTQDVEAITPQTLINIRPVVAAIKEFFGSSQLSQFMDQTNPLAGLTHKRRLSALGPGGLSRERAGFEVRDVHPSHYGRMCPIETPEGPNIGLIGYLSTYARINRFGFIETPYRKVREGVATEDIEYLAADDEDRYVIAQANARVDERGRFLDEKVLVRAPRRSRTSTRTRSTTWTYRRSRSSRWPRASSRSSARRRQPRLMGANMQRQAVPLLRSTAPFIGTGVEGRAARDAGDLVIADDTGTVAEVSGDSIVVDYQKNGRTTHRLSKFRRSNQGTCINQKPLVESGDHVRKGNVLADGPSTHNGELALAGSMAFMPGGHNYEDAIVISGPHARRRSPRSTSGARDHTRDWLGAEEITRVEPVGGHPQTSTAKASSRRPRSAPASSSGR